MKKISLSFLLLSFVSVAEAREMKSLPEIGDMYTPDQKQTEVSVPFVNWSQFYCTSDISVKNIKYKLYTTCNIGSEEGSRIPQEVRFIETTDPKFFVPEKISLGSLISEIEGDPSYGLECKKLPSGWNACVEVYFKESDHDYGQRITRFIK